MDFKTVEQQISRVELAEAERILQNVPLTTHAAAPILGFWEQCHPRGAPIWAEHPSGGPNVGLLSHTL